MSNGIIKFDYTFSKMWGNRLAWLDQDLNQARVIKLTSFHSHVEEGKTSQRLLLKIKGLEIICDERLDI